MYIDNWNECGGGGGNKVPVMGSDMNMLPVVRGSGGNKVPVEGTTTYEEGGCGARGGNNVPGEGDENEGVSGRRYIDDMVLVMDEQMLRLCVMIRGLVLLLTMELVVLGYVCVVYDVIQWLSYNRTTTETTERDWVVCGATSDGGVYVAENDYGNYGFENSFSLRELDDEESRRGGPTLDISDDGCDGPVIQDGHNSWLSESEKNHGHDLE